MPNLFLVGAPKCGTTALWAWLQRQPGVRMSPVKEPHFFGSDLEGRWFVRNADQYRALFAGVDRAHTRHVGEASVFYLYSRRAAEEIRQASPDARIIAVVRDPVTVMHALHSQLYYNGNEDIADFPAALAAEWSRRRTRRAPNDNYPPEVLWYRLVVAFAEQIDRFYAAFGRERVLVIVHDDLVARPDLVCREVLQYLGLDGGRMAALPRANPSKLVRSRWVHARLLHPPAAGRSLALAVLPTPLRRAVIRAAVAANTRTAPRQALEPDLQRTLRAEMAAEVSRLGRLLGRDLSAWTHGHACVRP